jgi:HD-GYP domain-containing protein (c-di-GMP phosphodiesterase class II)
MDRPLHNAETIAIDSSDASIGMYVSMLDRPWLETPFVFQGFTIKDRSETELLRTYCNIIYIDVQRSGLTRLQVKDLLVSGSVGSPSAAARPRNEKSSGKWSRRMRNLLLRLGLLRDREVAAEPATDGYKSTSTMRGEAQKALAAYKALSSQYREIAKFVDRNGCLPAGILRKSVQPLIESVLRNSDAMAWTIFSRRDGGRDSSRAVATSAWCVMFGRHLGFDREGLTDLAVGGLLLDIGNLRVPADILNAEGELTRQQRSTLSRHVEHGLQILSRSGELSKNIRDMVEYHHERADGSGYPLGLLGNKIPIYGRIAAIADCYDAMTTTNAYSPAYGAFDVARSLHDMRGKQFAAEVVEQFLCTVGMFPTASVVELNNGMIGLVLEQNRDNALRPKVMVLLNKDHSPLSKPKIMEMRDLPLDATHARAIWITQGHEHDAFGINPKDFFNSGG